MRNKIFVFALLAGTCLSLLSCTNSKIKLTKTQQDMALVHPSDEKWYQWKGLNDEIDIPYMSLWSTYDPDLFRFGLPPQAPVRIEFKENDEYDSVVYVPGYFDSSKKELEKYYDFFLDTRSYDESKETPLQYDDYFLNREITLLGEQVQSGQILDEKHKLGSYYCLKKDDGGMKIVGRFDIKLVPNVNYVLDYTSQIKAVLVTNTMKKNYLHNIEQLSISGGTDVFYCDSFYGLLFAYKGLPMRKDESVKSLEFRFNKKTYRFSSGFAFEGTSFREPNPFLQVQAVNSVFLIMLNSLNF